MASSKHTTSIVDISEIEDDEAPLAPTQPHHHQQQQQPAQYELSRHHLNADHQVQRSASATGVGNGASHNGPTSANSAHLYLFHEDLPSHQRIPNLLSTMISTTGGAAPVAHHDVSPGQTLLRPSGLPAIDYPNSADDNQGFRFRPQQPSPQPTPATPQHAAPTNGANGSEPAKANLGTLSGVYFPCVQNIFGVILFIRMVWIVGTAGVPAAFTLVFICCCVTLTTSISLSAIATNGIVPAGGSYFMISRSLGPECGGAVGTMFFLGTTVAGAMYITGAVEIMLNYLAPSWGLFGDFQRDVSIMYNNIRVYGSLLLIIVGLMVWIGVKFVSKLAPIALFCVLFSIFSIYAGIFINYNGRPDLMICVLGDRLVTLKNMPYDEAQQPFGQELDNQQQSFQQQQQQQSLKNATAKLSAAELATQYQLRRVKSLCTYEKLRYIYCPNELNQSPDVVNDFQQDNNQQLAAEGAESAAEKRVLQDLFKRPPNMSNCDPYFRANKDRIHLEKAVPGKWVELYWATQVDCVSLLLLALVPRVS